MISWSWVTIVRTALAPIAIAAAAPIGQSLYAQAKTKLSAEEIARLMDNPVGELIQLPIQYDRLSVRSPLGDETRAVTTIKAIPTFPLGRGRWRFRTGASIGSRAPRWADASDRRRRSCRARVRRGG